MRVISTLDCVDVYMDGIDVVVEKGSIKVCCEDGSIEIRPENKQIIIKDINVKYYELYKQKGD